MPRISFPFAFLKFYSPPLSFFPRLFFFFPLFFPFDRSFLVARKSRDERPGILFIEFRSATDAFSSWKQVSGSSCVFKLDDYLYDDSSLFSHDTISPRMELIGILINSYKRVDFKCYLFIFFFYLKIRILKKTSVRLRFANLNLKFTSGLNFEIQMKIKKKKTFEFISINSKLKKKIYKIHFCLFTRILTVSAENLFSNHRNWLLPFQILFEASSVRTIMRIGSIYSPCLLVSPSHIYILYRTRTTLLPRPRVESEEERE